ncbi:MAG: ABC transporter ATP-binding protein [Deltaproteobacteria bacterium]|nr:ABC transporter ATP-binding protein [Deltaproteobacteria bacterium]
MDADSGESLSGAPVTAPVAEVVREAISTSKLTRRFGAQVAVDGIDLAVPRGSFYGFLGENGAGKSTTISMLTGLLEPSGGTARVLERDVFADSTEVKRRIGVVPDGMLLFDRLTGREQLILVGRLFGLGRERSAARADELLATMELDKDGQKLVGDYSFGMKKKLSLACALIHGPELLFLDEPFEGVDAVAKSALTTLLAGLVERGKLTVFITSHVLEVVERLCTHVGVIHQGKLVAQGGLAEVVASVPGATGLPDAFVKLVGEGRAAHKALSFLP